MFSWLRCLQISEGKLRAIVESCGPVVLVMGGPPCEDLALVNADRTGVMGKKSGLLHYVFIVLDLLNIVQPTVKVHFLVENIQLMANHNKSYIDKRFGAHDALAAHSIAFNSKCLTPVSRPRLYWTNLPGAREHMAKLEHAPQNSAGPTLADALDPGRTTGATHSDCLLRSGQKGRPVVGDGGETDLLRPAEAERVMAIEGYTSKCGLSPKERLGLLGASWHLRTIVELLRPLAKGV